MLSRRVRLATLALLGVVLPAAVALAVIKVLTPLKTQIEKMDLIFVARVTEVLPERPGMVLQHREDLKGTAGFGRMPVNLTGDDEAKKDKHTEILLERVAADVDVVIFCTRLAKKYIGVGFTQGTWFSLEGRVEKADDGKEVVRWAFTHCEPYLRRTFKGTTPEMLAAVRDCLSKKKDPPEPNEKEEPGYGPPLKKQCDESPRTSLARHAPLLGVIQLPFMGAIIALAAIFPTVFGGLALMMKRWMVALSFSGIYSILVTLYLQMPGWLPADFLRTGVGFFLASAGLAAAFAFWSARRYRRALQQGNGDEMQPRRIDRWILGGFSVVLGGVLLLCTGGEAGSLFREPWLHLTVPTLTVLGITTYLFATYFRLRSHAEPRPALGTSAELVLLWSFVACCLLGTGLTAERPARLLVQGGGAAGALSFEPTPEWVFTAEHDGLLASSPCRTPDALILPVVRQVGTFTLGVVYAIDPRTGKALWKFDDDEELKAMFCTPTYHDGKVLFGEGFHTDTQSRVFCLDAKDGKKLWEFKTQSHAESRPAVGGGRVVFGAGNDGVYCVDLATGKELWHKGGMHVDAPPLVHDGRVYLGSGKSRQFPDANRIFCLDLADGAEVWGERLERSAYAAPRLDPASGVVYFGTGNGTYDQERDALGGQVLARDARTGKKLWDAALPGTILGQPALDRHLLYVGGRDGTLAALDRATGEVFWRRAMGGPVLAAPALALDPEGRRGELLFAVTAQGNMAGLVPYTGAPFWSADANLFSSAPHVHAVSTPLLEPLAEAPGGHRLYLGTEEGLGAGGANKPRLYCFTVRPRQ